MSRLVHQLSHLDFFDFTDLSGTPCRGADQEWYRDPWQRRGTAAPPQPLSSFLISLMLTHPFLLLLPDIPTVPTSL